VLAEGGPDQGKLREGRQHAAGHASAAGKSPAHGPAADEGVGGTLRRIAQAARPSP